MTLRDIGKSIEVWAENFATTVTTKNILDWEVGHLMLTGFVAFIAVTFLYYTVEGFFDDRRRKKYEARKALEREEKQRHEIQL